MHEISYSALPAGAAEGFEQVMGQPIRTFVIHVLLESGKVATLFPPGTNPALIADLARDGVHHLVCPGCVDCR